ncbi:MAG: hypothetical protein Q4F03_03905 [Eubacteriales bacterium]|nr:hypothetical protein [Eubacteriales bacterium]
MKRKLFTAVMIIFTILLAIILFVSLICGAPVGRSELGMYVVGALGISILLPAGFTFFFLVTLRLSERTEEAELEELEDTETENRIPALVCAIAKERNLSSEEKERIISFIEDL